MPKSLFHLYSKLWSSLPVYQEMVISILNRSVSIGARFLILFLVYGLLSAISTYAWWYAFSDIQEQEKAIIEVALPSMDLARQLSDQRTSLVTTAQLMIAATTDEQRDKYHTELENILSRLKSTLEPLIKHDALHHSEVNDIYKEMEMSVRNTSLIVEQKMRNLFRQDYLRKKIGFATETIKNHTSIISANSRSSIVTTIASFYSMLDDSVANEDLFNVLDHLIDVELDTSSQLIFMSHQILELISTLNSAVISETINEVDQHQKKIKNILSDLTIRAPSVYDPFRRKKIIDSLNTLNSVYKEFFDGIKKSIELTHSISQQAIDQNNLLSLMSHKVDTLIHESYSNTNLVTSQVNQTISLTKDIQGISTIILALVFISGALDIYRNVISRLNDVSDKITELAHGNLNIEIGIQGQDEITKLARAVRVFKENAIALKRHKSELESIVEQRTSELTEANNALNEAIEKSEAARIIAEEARLAAEAADKAKSTFLAHMSHEIRTPMNGIVGTLRMLCNTDLTETQKKYSLVIRDSCQLLLNVLNNVLDYSKIESGKYEITEKNFSISNLVSTVTSMMAAKATEKGLKLIYFIDQDVPPCLIGDSSKICQVLVNLVSNGIKFSDSGLIEIQVHNALTKEDGTCLIKIVVTDTGKGIPPDKIEHIFKPFEQASPDDQGTGLGLSICNRFAKILGGKLDVRSQVDKGSQFTLTIPLKTGMQETAPCQNVELPPVPKLDMLLVEDNETNILVAESFIKELGHNVTVARTGAEAMQICNNISFDMILMDINLPDTEGVTLTRQIREKVGKRTPTVAFSAHVFRHEIAAYLDAGLDGFLGKPVQFERLQTVIAEVYHSKIAFLDAIPDEPAKDTLQIEEVDLFNPEVLEEDYRILPQQVVWDIIHQFIEHSKKLHAQIEANESRDALQRASHGLKSSAGAVGLIRLVAACDELEKACKLQRPDETIEKLRQILLAAYVPSIAKLESELRAKKNQG